MSVYLGNLSVEQIEKEYGFTFTDEERNRLKELQHHAASFNDGETGWHMFDIPRHLCVSKGKVGREVLNIFQKHNSEIKGSFSAGYGNYSE